MHKLCAQVFFCSLGQSYIFGSIARCILTNRHQLKSYIHIYHNLDTCRLTAPSVLVNSPCLCHVHFDSDGEISKMQAPIHARLMSNGTYRRCSIHLMCLTVEVEPCEIWLLIARCQAYVYALGGTRPSSSASLLVHWYCWLGWVEQPLEVPVARDKQ